MTGAIAILIPLIALMQFAKTFAPAEPAIAGRFGVALALGFLLLAAMQIGRIFSALKLPRLTGYLATGVLFGPDVLGFITRERTDSLGLINGVAIGIIALTAGAEMNLRNLRPRMRSILLVGGLALAVAALAIGAVLFTLSAYLPFLAEQDLAARLTIITVLAIVLSSLSPTVVLAMLNETESKGPLSETILGVVVIADLVIIIAFAGAHAWAASRFGGGAGDLEAVPRLAVEIFGSAFVGLILAGLLALYVRHVGETTIPVVLGATLMAAEVGARFHLDVLIICLTAGLLLENVMRVRGEFLARDLTPASIPVFIVFFAVAGAKLHLHDLAAVWWIALVVAAVRAAALALGAAIGARVARAEPAVSKYGPFAIIPQAGVSIGLAILVERHFPTWGSAARALVLGVVTINELTGPVILKIALTRSGEAGTRQLGERLTTELPHGADDARAPIPPPMPRVSA